MRHVHLVLAPASISAARELIPFRVLLDDEAPGLSAMWTSTRTGTARSRTAGFTSSFESTTRADAADHVRHTRRRGVVFTFG